MYKSKKIKRFKYHINDTIIGLTYDKAQEICIFNGYKIGLKSKFYGINVETKDGIIVNASYYN